MFIGHYAPAFAAAAHRDSPPLWLGTAATQAIDLAFFSFALLGIEHYRLTPGITATNWLDLYDMPYTHSLLGACGFGISLALFTFAIWRNARMALITAALVVSHWVLDILVHRPDLTLAGSPPRLGLGLWNLPLIEKPLELALCFGTLAYYLSRTRPTHGSAKVAAGVLIVALAAFQAIDWFGARTTKLEPGQQYLALFAYTVVIALSGWVGRTRTLKA